MQEPFPPPISCLSPACQGEFAADLPQSPVRQEVPPEHDSLHLKVVMRSCIVLSGVIGSQYVNVLFLLLYLDLFGSIYIFGFKLLLSKTT